MNKMKVVLIIRCLQMAESSREGEKDRRKMESERVQTSFIGSSLKLVGRHSSVF